MAFSCGFLVVHYRPSDLLVSIGVDALKYFFEIKIAFLKIFSYFVEALTVSKLWRCTEVSESFS